MTPKEILSGALGGLAKPPHAAQGAIDRLHLALRDLARLQRAASAERRPWEPGGSGRGSD